MKLFDDMSPIEKLDHCELHIADGLMHFKAEYPPIYLANILDVWDYWCPYLIERCRKLEKVREAALTFPMYSLGQDCTTKNLVAKLVETLKACEEGKLKPKS